MSKNLISINKLSKASARSAIRESVISIHRIEVGLEEIDAELHIGLTLATPKHFSGETNGIEVLRAVVLSTGMSVREHPATVDRNHLANAAAHICRHARMAFHRNVVSTDPIT